MQLRPSLSFPLSLPPPFHVFTHKLTHSLSLCCPSCAILRFCSTRMRVCLCQKIKQTICLPTFFLAFISPSSSVCPPVHRLITPSDPGPAPRVPLCTCPYVLYRLEWYSIATRIDDDAIATAAAAVPAVSPRPRASAPRY
ncbi:unnamed protein product [Hydatigera taeniaeformis]|uniref:Uncharacterized protein n=1 Tax=Hydatigena taeniaeformis TaxID=6205 RepID=A0A0R3WVG8_HYDTA|nr:unnamed protein product [Hydatigera taeniaeformis]